MSVSSMFRSWVAMLLLAMLMMGCDSARQDNEVGDAPDLDDGRRMYQDGKLPSGEPLTAIVAGDVPVLGTQFSCESCHGRSGMGASEGKYIVPPIAGQFLFAPSPQPARPAYTEESLARLLREGMTPDGRYLGELMPLYKLTDDEITAMTAYLARLSYSNSPGVDDKIIRFATVITEDVEAGERTAVLDVLNTFVGEKNSNTRLESERWDRGYTPSSRLATVHRDWVLEEWTLTGPPESWDKQLEQRYREAPVFAMLSGLSNDSWGPIGRFCERHEIACLFPGTRVTDAAEGDFYTLYYSRGLELEADLIANHLAAQPVTEVIQVFCGAAPAKAASALRSSLQTEDLAANDLGFECDDALPVAELIERSESLPNAAIVLWLEQEHLAAIEGGLLSGRVYFSSTLLGEEYDRAFPSVTGPAFMAHPYRLPGQVDPAMARFEAWAKSRGIDMTAPRRQSEAFFACLVLKDAVKHIGRFFIREFMLDMLDHAQSIVAYLPYYPRPTLGPGQRFVNKGGYVLPIVDGQPVTQDATWILP